MNLLPSQYSALNQLRSFLLGEDNNCFILRGSAGTGKTTLLGHILEDLKKSDRPVKLLAPTGRAARILGVKAKADSSTIHRCIYNFKELREYRDTDKEGNETFKFFFVLNNSESVSKPVFIVDEASMVGNRYQEQEFFRFGSGRILQDLIEFINFSGNRNAKLILVGDGAQLPPVGENFSPALDAEFLSTNFNLLVQEAELREVIRQQDNSTILRNANSLRNSIEQKSFNKLSFTASGDTTAVPLENLMLTYLDACENKISEKAIIICQGNLKSQRYNKIVRDHFFPNKAEIQPADRVMVVLLSHIQI